MKIYVLGAVGGASYFNYDIPIEYLKYNLDPNIRKNIFEILKGDGLVNDISDGLDKSLYNLLYYEKNLDILIFEKKLWNLLPNKFKAPEIPLNLNHIKYGGDDYSLIIATFHPLNNIPKVTEIGFVDKGSGKVIYL